MIKALYFLLIEEAVPYQAITPCHAKALSVISLHQCVCSILDCVSQLRIASCVAYFRQHYSQRAALIQANEQSASVQMTRSAVIILNKVQQKGEQYPGIVFPLTAWCGLCSAAILGLRMLT